MNNIKTTMLMAAMVALFMVVGDALAGRQGAIIFLFIAGAMNFGAYWFSDKIVLKMYKAKEVDEDVAPGLLRMVRTLSQRAELPMPKVYVMDNPTPNAFATGRNPQNAAIAFTTGIMTLLEDGELEGVAAHELAHIKNRDTLISTVSATIAGAISYLSQMAMWASMFGGRRNSNVHPAVYILIMILAPIAAAIVQMMISRTREFGADRVGAGISGNPMGLANALRKLTRENEAHPMEKANDATAHMFIVNPLSVHTMSKLFSTHPPLRDRIRLLENMAAGIR